jgi:hypothetical protein
MVEDGELEKALHAKEGSDMSPAVHSKRRRCWGGVLVIMLLTAKLQSIRNHGPSGRSMATPISGAAAALGAAVLAACFAGVDATPADESAPADVRTRCDICIHIYICVHAYMIYE